MQTFDIALIGCGNMGAALAGGYAKASPRAKLLAIDPDTARARSLLPAGEAVTVRATIGELGEARPGMTVLAVKPQSMEAVVPDFAARPAADGLVVSIAAGVSVASLRRHLPRARIVRAMPNTPALAGTGFTGLWGDETVQADDRARCDSLFGAVGVARWLETEEEIDAVTAVSGSGPAYFFAFVEAVVAAGRALGLPEVMADEMARATMAGAAAMLRDPGTQPAALKRAVRSPNGTTDAALRVFEADDALPDLVSRAIAAAHARAVVLRGPATSPGS